MFISVEKPIMFRHVAYTAIMNTEGGKAILRELGIKIKMHKSHSTMNFTIYTLVP